MKLKEIKDSIQAIKDTQSDYEVAHSMEDDLHIEFINHVAECGDEDLRLMALEVLKTSKLTFPRYTA
jgi:hypothetical protein